MAIDQGGNSIATADNSLLIHAGAPASKLLSQSSGIHANTGRPTLDRRAGETAPGPGGALDVADGPSAESSQRRLAARHSAKETTLMVKVRQPLPEALWRIGWPWKAAADVTDPEMQYWLRRVEQSCELQLSLDLLRAAKIELRALDSHRSRSDRLVSCAVN